MIEPLLRTLKNRFPNTYIILIGNDVASAISPYLYWVDEVINIGAMTKQLALAQRFSIARSLRKRQVERAIIVPNSYKSALIPFFAGIAKRIGYVGEYRYGLLTDARQYPANTQREVDRFTALGYERDEEPSYVVPQLTIEQDVIDATKNKFGISAHPLLVIAPGAEFGPSKKWTQYGFDAILKWATEHNIQTLLVGTKKDQEQFTMPDGTNALNLMGSTTIDEALALCSIASVVLCHDSGLMHAACALGTDVVALYGPTSAERTPPLPPAGIGADIVEAHDVPCRPCYKKVCPLGHHHCMTHIDSTSIIEILAPKLIYG